MWLVQIEIFCNYKIYNRFLRQYKESVKSLFHINIYLIYINILYCLYIEVMLKIKYIIKINFTYFFLVYKMCY